MERYIFGILVLICLIFINSRVLCADCNSNQDCTATSFTLASCSTGNCDCVNTQYASVRTGCAIKLPKPNISTVEGRSTFLITGTSDLLVCSTVGGAKRYDWFYNDNLFYSGENVISINRTGKYKCKAIAWTLSLNSDTSDEIVITKIGVGKYPWNLTVGISAESKLYNGRSVSLTCIGAPMGYMDKVIFESTYNNLITEEAYSITSMTEVLNMSYALDGVSIRCTLDSFKAIYFSPSINSVTLPTVCDIMNPANNGCAALPIATAVLTVHDPIIGLITTDTTYNVGADGPILNCTTTPAPQYLDSSKPLKYTFLAGTKSLWTGTSSTYTVDTRTSSSTAFTCQVNFDGVNTTSTPSVIITVSNDYLAVPTIIKKTAGEIEIESTLVLSCGDSSYVADSYQWSISGKTIERQYDKTIQIYKFAIADIGLYQCRAVKSRYTTADATFDAIMKPTATRLTAGNFYAAAGSYDFKCDSGTGGTTAWSYLWLKNGQSTRISSGTYNIYGANAASHDGSYACNLMYNGATRTSDPLTVQIITLKPTITSQPSVKGNFYGAGVRYVLRCNTDSGVTAGWTYTWIKDKIDMQINSDTYEITQASAAIHDGVYTCISTYSGVSTSSDALTVIIVAAILAMNDTNGQISADKAFNVSEDGPKLTCAVTRQLPNANTLVYTFWDDVSVLQQGSSVNYIIDTSVPSNTTYRCSVTYDWFTTFSQTSARIAVTMKPYISIRPISSFYGAGNNYVLKCNTDSRVINGWTFSWIKNNTDLHNNADVYSITNATAALHDGVYTCTSTYNRVASTSYAVTVTIIAAVMTISDVGDPILTDTTYNVGSAGPTLTCTTTPPLANASTVTYTFWDSVSSIQSSSSETYMVNGYIPSNTTFRCGVNYDGSTTYSSISARIAFSNDYIAVPTLSKTSLEDLAVGSNFELTCGDPTIVVDYYQWFFDDVLIENHIANVLQRISFTESDIGVYKCRAVKSRYTTANASFSAIMKPRISRNPSGTFYGAGVNYSLRCISGSNLKIGWVFSWTKELTDMQINSGVYSITNATASLHDGVYTCTSTYNRIASTSDALTVTVVAATLIVADYHGSISIDTTYNVGAEGPTLTCRTTSQLPSENTATYTFMSDTTSVQEGSLNTYTLDNSIRSNTSYKCSVTYDGSITYSPSSPRIEFSEDFIAVSSIIKTSLGDITIGSTLTLLCGETIDADFYQWFFDNTMIENQSNKRLERPRFTERDIGVYKCRAVKSRYTTANATFTAGIKPEIIRQTSGTFYGAGVNYDLKCNTGLTITTGWTFSWTKNNNDLFNDAEVYSIANATATLHDGVYTCTSTYNTIASTSDALTVTVVASIMTISEVGGPILTDTTYNVRSAGPTLTCTTTPPLANASPVIFTFLNDTSSVHSSYSETYALNINIPSNTTYKCSVTYEGSTTYSPTSVRIAFSNDYIAVPTLSKTSLEDLAVGSNFVLTCGDPTIVVDYYQWFFDDVLIENHIANVLQRTRFTESDIGKYKCRAVKSRYTTANATFPAIMKPAITRQTSGTFYGAGVNYVLMCNSGSMETNGWTYSWAKDNRDLNIHADNYVITNATSAIHDGTYTCNSTYNFVSSTSNAITVSVVAAILIVEDSHGPISNDTTYNVGADGPTLTCSTTRPLPSDNTVTYIFMNDTSSIEASSSNVYTLISNIPSSSTYKCSVTYDKSTTLSPSSARIAFSNNFISDPSIVKVSLGDITFGSTLALSCGDTTINADFYQWFFYETMIENQSNKRLERPRFTERDIGVYKCRAVKSRYTTANATFTAGMKPEITRQPAGSFYVAGVNYDLKCNTGLTVTTGWTFSWTMDNNDLHNDAEVYSITNATATLHDGVYTCTSTYNRVASTSDALTVTVVAAVMTISDVGGPILTDTTYNVGSAGPTLTCTTTPPLANASTVTYTFLNDTTSIHVSYSETYTLNGNLPSSSKYKCGVTYDRSTIYSPTSAIITFSNNFIAVPTIIKTSPGDLALGFTFSLTCGDATLNADFYQWFFDETLIENQRNKELQRAPFTEADIGVFKCRAIKSRYRTANATFTAVMKPTLNRQTLGSFYGAGSSYVLKCNSGSNAQIGWTYAWAKESRDLNIHADNYQITNATAATHDGTYTCTSTYNRVSSISNNLTVIVVAATLIVEDSHGPISIDTTYNVGAEGPTLTCGTTSQLPSENTVTYTFMNDTSSIDEGSSDTYTLNKNVPSNSTYSCTVTYDLSTTYSSQSPRIAFSNNFISDPSIMKVSPGDITLGSNLTLSCGDTTIHADFYQWFFDETMIENQSNKRLELSRFTERDIGVYKCRAVESRYTTANATFTAGIKPQIIREPSGSFYGAGGTYILRCSTYSSLSTGWSYSWTKNSNVISGSATQSYTITNASAAIHNGVYSCTTTYNGVSSTSDNLPISIISATLIVTDPLGHLTTDTTYNVGVDGPNLTCTTTPELENINSSKHMRYEFWNGQISLQDGISNTYTIDTATEHSATYNCSVTYDGTTTYSLPSSNISFRNKYIPDPVIYKQNPDELSIGSTLVLSCGDETTVADIFQWTIKDKVPQNQQSQTFRVDNFSLDDIGVYKCCVVKSRYITAEASFVAIMKPSITRVPSGTFYGAGCDYTLLCNSGSSETVGWTYLWTKNSVNTTTQTASYILHNASSSTHDGVFTCTSAYNGVSSTSDSLNITIVEAILVVTDSTGPVITDTVYNVGSDGPTLTCTTTHVLADFNIEIPAVYEFSDGTKIVQTGRSNTSVLDSSVVSSATYNCSLEFDGSTTYSSKSSTITFSNNYVSDPTIIKESDDDVTIGSDLVLSCGDNTIAADIYLWYFQELYISDQSSKIIERENFTEDNIGMYKCRAVKSRYTTANASFVAIMKPTITRETSGTFYGAGGDYVLRCNSGSSATEGWTYTWTKSGNVDASTTVDSYTITNATAATHDGNYSCSSMYNGVSSTSDNLTITIIAATLIVRDSIGPITIDTTYNVGADGPNLTCTTTPELENIDSSKNITYDFWNGLVSLQEGPLNTYTIYSGSENSATYNCSVTYDGTTTYSLPSSTIAFSNSYIPDPVIYKQNPDELSIESTLVLSCGDETTVADIFEWTIKDTVPQYQTSQTIQVENFSLDDIGVYKCRVVRSRYITAEASFVAIMKPTITREPSGIFYGAGCDYNLLCNSGSNESVGWTYLWAKDGENTSLQSDSYFLENATAATNNGVYTCTSSYNGVSSTSNGLNITIVAAILEVTDTIGPVTTDTVYNAGSDGPTLTCTTTEELADYDIEIPPVYEFSDGTEIIQTGPSNTYSLNTFVLSSASYNCSITFDGSTTFSLPTYNIEISDNYVPDPTLFKESADDFTIGIPVILSCGDTTVDGDYYVWYFQDNPILDRSSKILRHDNFTEDDIGVYTCRAVKSRYTTANTSLIALMKPTITREPSGTFYGAGGDYILRCNSGSSFTTGWDFSWTKDGNLTISVSDSYTIENATADEYDGVYACTSSYNGVSRVSDDLSITVVAASLVVDDLTGLITTDTTYNIGADGPTLTCITTPVLAFLSGAEAVQYDFSDGIKSIQKRTSNTFSINMFALSNTTYNCSVTYDGTSTFSSSSPTISVSNNFIAMPYVVKESTGDLILGVAVILSCGGELYVADLYHWSFNDNTIEGQNNKTIQLYNFTEADIGVYKCRAVKSRYTTAEASFHAVTKPTITREPEGTFYGEGGDYVLRCNTGLNITTGWSFSWKRNSFLTTNFTNIFVITEANAATHNGFYTCASTYNRASSISNALNVTIVAAGKRCTNTTDCSGTKYTGKCITTMTAKICQCASHYKLKGEDCTAGSAVLISCVFLVAIAFMNALVF